MIVFSTFDTSAPSSVLFSFHELFGVDTEIVPIFLVWARASDWSGDVRDEPFNPKHLIFTLIPAITHACSLHYKGG